MCLRCADLICFDVGKDSEVLCFPSPMRERKEFENCIFPIPSPLVYNPVLKRFERSYKMKTIVKISEIVMKENFCLWYFFHPPFQGLPVDFGKRKGWVKQVGMDTACRETFDQVGGAVMKDF